MPKMKLIAEILTYIFLIASINADNKLRLVQEWKEFDFQFPDEASKLDAESRNHYTRGESVPLDIDVFYNGNKTKIFVTIPRFSSGRPFTLATINNKPGSNSQSLKPYPDYSWHVNQGENCNGMTSVFRIAIDECRRLWVVDTGFIGDDRVCPTQILVFDLMTDNLILRHILDQRVLRQHSLLVTPVVDVRDPQGGCSNTFVYIADVTGYGIVVYDVANDKSWRVDNKLTYPFPPYGTFHIQGEEFDLMDGVIGMALSPLRDPYEDRILYFHALASITENYVKTSVLRNASAWDAGFSLIMNARDFQVFKKTRQSQSVAEAMDQSGVLFFGLLTPCSIACWNSATEYSPKNMDIIAHDHETLQFPSGIKIVNNLDGQQELWVISCRLQKLITGTMNMNEVNFRVQAGKVDRLLKGTKCDRPNGATSYQNNFVGGRTTPYGAISSYGGTRYR